MALTLVYVFMWHKHFDVHFTLIFAFIPVANVGYFIGSTAKNAEEMIMAQKVIYLGGCFLTLFILMCVLDRCKIVLKRIIRIAIMAFTFIVYGSVLTIGKYDIFYKSYSYEIVNGVGVAHKQYGPMHTVFMLMIVIYYAISLFALVYSLYKKKDVSSTMIKLLFIPETICFVSFFLGRIITRNTFEVIPLGYVISQVVYLIIVNRLCLYDINAVNADTILESGDKGFISVDFNNNYLGCNDTAKSFIPELAGIRVDSNINKNKSIGPDITKWIGDFKENERKDKVFYHKNDKVYLVDIDYLFDGKRKRGYCLTVSDDTKNQKYIELINSFNTKLQEEVEEKTEHIVEMHNKLILGMATMVESRDNSTGGHIKRTSEGVRILIEEIMSENKLGLSDEFCKDIIKAAPMHDLGKISVDDAVLRKPGRFEPDEFEKMKKHAPEGARIIHEILKDTDDEHFRKIAENVANYHHERWDGSGYPEGLKGEEIPIEARIMAIADVYDALVSKRVYKESMSFEEADKIIMDGMGKHFDKALEPYYISAKPKLEAYYTSLDGH
ncbi:MAG: HD domain-containing protein [Lachnospiraceae bacterium]|nr:HD domain-containing protein [Lachnospiraceae bacterium]